MTDAAAKPLTTEPGPKAQSVMHRVNALREKAHVNRRASREWRAIANSPTASLAEHSYHLRLAEVTEQIAKCYDDCAAALFEVTVQLDEPPPAPAMKTLHVALSVDIDRFSDAVIARDWLPLFAKNHVNGDLVEKHGLELTVADVRRVCADARARGLEVFPPCDNTDANGYCQHGKAAPGT